MKRHILLASIGATALAMVPAVASAEIYTDPDSTTITSTFDESVNIEVEFLNGIDTTIDTHVDFDKAVTLTGDVELEGKIKVDAAAVAVSDPKQIVEDNKVVEFGGEGEGNRIREFSVDGRGNIGVNVAAGTFNTQANVATIATAAGDDKPGNGPPTVQTSDGPPGDPPGHNKGDGGWAEATTASLQKLLNNTYVGGVANTVNLGDIGGQGNIGVNAASGAFNVQENVLTLASVTDSTLAEANAGVIQASVSNSAYNYTTDNSVNIGTVGGAGNIGVNAAAGVGNIQHNSLTVAASLANGS